MVISTKGRYALRLMIDLAQHCDEGYISLKTVAQRQNVSLKYMEAIAAALNRASLVLSQRGKEGGYCLSRPACDITVAQVLHSTEGSMAAVACLESGGELLRARGAVSDAADVEKARRRHGQLSVERLRAGSARRQSVTIAVGEGEAILFPRFFFLQIPIDKKGNT